MMKCNGQTNFISCNVAQFEKNVFSSPQAALFLQYSKHTEQLKWKWKKELFNIRNQR